MVCNVARNMFCASLLLSPRECNNLFSVASKVFSNCFAQTWGFSSDDNHLSLDSSWRLNSEVRASGDLKMLFNEDIAFSDVQSNEKPSSYDFSSSARQTCPRPIESMRDPPPTRGDCGLISISSATTLLITWLSADLWSLLVIIFLNLYYKDVALTEKGVILSGLDFSDEHEATSILS